MGNGKDVNPSHSGIGEKANKEQEKEVISKVDFAKDGLSVSIYLSLKSNYINTAIFTLRKLEFDILMMMHEHKVMQIMKQQKERDILQANDPMGTNAKKDPSFFKKHFLKH